MSNKTSIRAALFTLAGGGDKMVFLAPAEALEWCNGVKPGQRGLTDELKKAIVPFLDTAQGQEPDLDETTQITTGSADNDAAIFLSCLCREFENSRKAQAFAKDKGWVIVEEEYDGCIY